MAIVSIFGIFYSKIATNIIVFNLNYVFKALFVLNAHFNREIFCSCGSRTWAARFFLSKRYANLGRPTSVDDVRSCLPTNHAMTQSPDRCFSGSCACLTLLVLRCSPDVLRGRVIFSCLELQSCPAAAEGSFCFALRESVGLFFPADTRRVVVQERVPSLPITASWGCAFQADWFVGWESLSRVISFLMWTCKINCILTSFWLLKLNLML